MAIGFNRISYVFGMCLDIAGISNNIIADIIEKLCDDMGNPV